MRVGVDLSQSPSSVGTGTSSVTVTAKFYIETKASVYDSTNTAKMSGSVNYSGSADISHGSGGGTTLVATKTYSVSTSYTGSKTTSVSVSLTGVNAISGTATETASITTGQRPYSSPAAPASVTASLGSSTSITVKWTNKPTSSAPYSRVEIQRAVNGTWGGTSNLSATTSSYTGSSLTPNTKYQWRVRSVNSSGASGWVNSPAITTPPLVPDAPSAVTVTRTSDVSHTIRWTNNNATSATKPYASVEVQRWDIVSNAWSTMATLSGTSTSYTNTSTKANNQYRWRVRATNSAGGSGYAYSNYWSTTPSAPNAPKATKGTTDITLTWTNTAKKITGIEVWHGANGVREGTRLALLTGAATSWTHTNPDATKTHTYWLKTQNGADSNDDAPTLYSDFSGASNVVQLLTNPSAPTKLSPASVTVDANEPLVLTWQHNPRDDTNQTAYNLRYRVDGGSWVSTGKKTSTASQHTFPVGTFTNGTRIEWEVCTYGQYAVSPEYSPWSATAILDTSARPGAAVSYPEDVVGTSRITATWEYYDEEGSDQAQYQVRLYSAGGANVLETRAGVGNATEQALTTLLKNNTAYRVGVSVQDGSGLWSPENIKDFTVSYALPPRAVVVVTPDSDTGSALVNIENPAPGDNDGTAVYNEVWRSIDWETYELVAGNVPLNSAITDYVPALGTETVYKVVTFTDLGAAAESEIVVITVPLSGKWFWLNAGQDFSESARFRYNPSRTRSFSRIKTLNQFAGRLYPVETTGEARESTIDLSFLSIGDDDSDLDRLQDIVDMPAPVCFRGPSGEHYYTSVESVSGASTGSGESVSMKLTRVSRPNVEEMDFDPVVYQTNLARNPSFENQIGITEANLYNTGAFATAELSNAWSDSGYQSVKIIPSTGNVNHDSSLYPWTSSAGTATAQLGLKPGVTYTISAVIHFETAQSGDLNPAARRITVNFYNRATNVTEWNAAMSDAAPNVPGTYRLSVTFSMPEDGRELHVRLMNGSKTVPVWWDSLMVTRTDEPVDYFDGDTMAGTGSDLRTIWLGAPHDSVSQIVRGGKA